MFHQFEKQKGDKHMRETIMQIIQNYQIIAIAVISLLAVIVLLRMQRQLKKMNRNFSIITGKMQEYFDVILQEEAEEEEPVAKREEGYAQRFMPQEGYLSKQEKEMLLSNPKSRATKA